MEEVLDGFEGLGPAFDNIAAGLSLELLPPFLPEPGLVPVDGFLGNKDDSVIDDLGQDDAPVCDPEFFPH
jgi:hypothetical protein